LSAASIGGVILSPIHQNPCPFRKPAGLRLVAIADTEHDNSYCWTGFGLWDYVGFWVTNLLFGMTKLLSKLILSQRLV
jgi:hypothetical protein